MYKTELHHSHGKCENGTLLYFMRVPFGSTCAFNGNSQFAIRFYTLHDADYSVFYKNFSITFGAQKLQSGRFIALTDCSLMISRVCKWRSRDYSAGLSSSHTCDRGFPDKLIEQMPPVRFFVSSVKRNTQETMDSFLERTNPCKSVFASESIK